MDKYAKVFDENVEQTEDDLLKALKGKLKGGEHMLEWSEE